jgi:hypothetical protein
MRGRVVRQTLDQRAHIDSMRFVLDVPSYTDGRRMNLAAVAAARAQSRARPRWLAIFAKACALLSQEIPVLRQVYLRYPWPHLYEYPVSAALILIGRVHVGEEFYFNYVIKDPGSLPLAEIDRRLTHAATAPANEVKEFRRAFTFLSLPGPIRRLALWLAYNIGRQRSRYFGTFVVTYPPAGRVSGYLSLWTSRYTCETIGADGFGKINLTIDHRVVNAKTLARALDRLEQILNGPIVDELHQI